MQDFWQALTTHPMTPWFGWLALGTLAIFWGMGQVRPHLPEDPIENLQKTLGMEGVSGWLLTIAALFWIAIFGVLFIGLLSLLADIAWSIAQPETREGKGDFRFLLTKTTALTAVLAAVVAVPFTIVRIKLTAEQNRHAQDVLYNEKLNEAVESLHSRYQVTENGKDVWKDDIIKRNGAIDRLEARAVERPEMASRIARMLSVYLRELTRAYPAIPVPENTTLNGIHDWARQLTVQRSDMEAAAQLLGRLPTLIKSDSETLNLDLQGVNLQAMHLDGLDFSHAQFSDCNLDGANLRACQCKGASFDQTTFLGTAANGTDFSGSQFNRSSLIAGKFEFSEWNGSSLMECDISEATFAGASFRTTDFEDIKSNRGTNLGVVDFSGAHFLNSDLSKVTHFNLELSETFGDCSTRLPKGVIHPKHWPYQSLGRLHFLLELQKFQRNPDAYIPPQHRNT